MHLLIDMNLSPQWCAVLENEGITTTHWRDVGAVDAPDRAIFEYAQLHNHVVFTHDLDFGDILAATGETRPSVIQMRTDDPSPTAMQHHVIAALHQFEQELESGALIVIEPQKSRARLLPIE